MKKLSQYILEYLPISKLDKPVDPSTLTKIPFSLLEEDVETLLDDLNIPIYNKGHVPTVDNRIIAIASTDTNNRYYESSHMTEFKSYDIRYYIENNEKFDQNCLNITMELIIYFDTDNGFDRPRWRVGDISLKNGNTKEITTRDSSYMLVHTAVRPNTYSVVPYNIKTMIEGFINEMNIWLDDGAFNHPDDITRADIHSIITVIAEYYNNHKKLVRVQ